MNTPTDLERLRDEAAAQRLKELTPYMSDKERQRLIDEGRSETYTSVQLGFNTAVEIMSERLTLAEQDRDSWKRSFVEARDAGGAEITRLRAALALVVDQFEDMSDSNDIREHWYQVAKEALSGGRAGR